MSNIGSKNTTTVTLGSANVFADLGVTDPDLALAKVQLAERVIHIVRELQLTKVQAARRLGIDQSKLSAIERGRVRGFTIDELLRWLARLGQPVTFRFDNAPPELANATPTRLTGAKTSR
jgi:predicted XRE-type DNA-binding protein